MNRIPAVGDVIVLHAVPDEDIPEEVLRVDLIEDGFLYGTVPPPRDPWDRDGLREVWLDDLADRWSYMDDRADPGAGRAAGEGEE